MIIPRAILLTLSFGGALVAQITNPVGFTTGWTTTFTDRVGANNINADILNHFDTRSYQDWLLDPADPTGATFKPTAVRFVIQDQIGNTPENYQIVAYNEDPTPGNENFPDPNPTGSGVWFRTGNFAMPASTATGPVAWIITVTLAATTPSAPKGDKWIGINLTPPAVGTWPTDGASLHCAFGRDPASTAGNTNDRGGPRLDSVPNGNFACTVPTTAVTPTLPTAPATYPAAGTGGSGRRQIRLEVLGNVTGGVCVTQTNQTSYPSSNPGVVAGATPLGGTTNFISGLHPDINDSLATTPARLDDIGFLVTEVNRPNSIVLVLVALGPSPVGSLPLTAALGGAITPTSRGNLCADFVNGVTFLGISDAQGVFQQMLTLTPAARTLISSLSAPGAPVDLWYQGIVVDLSAGLDLRASGCGIQHL